MGKAGLNCVTGISTRIGWKLRLSESVVVLKDHCQDWANTDVAKIRFKIPKCFMITPTVFLFSGYGITAG